jgi:hypothetical protein
LKRFAPAECCEEGKLWIMWDHKQPPPKTTKRGRPYAQEGEGPERDGWTMMVGDNCCVNVKFCPFCGKKFGE